MLFVAVFLVTIILPGLGLICDFGTQALMDFRRLENRDPNSFPKFSKGKNIKTLLHEFEGYFEDHYSFRNRLVKIKNTFDYNVLNISPVKDQVAVGKDGWLFLNKLDNSLKQHSQISIPKKTDQINRYLNIQKRKHDFLQRRGIKYFIVIAPDKETIYPDYLPSYIRYPNHECLTDDIMDSSVDSDLNIISLKQALLGARKNYGEILYYKTDTHWTDLGAFYGYKHIIKEMEKQLGPLESLDIESYSKRNVIAVHDLSNMLDIFYIMKDHALNIKYTGPIFPIEYYFHNHQPVSPGQRARLSMRSNYYTINKEAPNPYTVFVIGDSFFSALAPLFNRTFQRCFYAHAGYPLKDKEMGDILVFLKPDILMFEIIERRVGHQGLVFPYFLEKGMKQAEAQSIWSTLPGVQFALCPDHSSETDSDQGNSMLPAQKEVEIIIDSHGDHPHLEIPLTGDVSNHVIVHLVIESPRVAPIEINHRDMGDKNYKKIKKSTRLNKGDNEVFLEIRGKNNIGRIKLTPGKNTGKYALKTLEIKNVPDDILLKFYRQ